MNMLAERIFDAIRDLGRREDQVCDVLHEVFGEDGWEDFSIDPYDGSIEVYGVTTEGPWDLRILARHGFALVWIHPGEKGGGYDCSMQVGGRCGCRAWSLRTINEAA